MKTNFPVLDFFRIFCCGLIIYILSFEGFSNYPFYPDVLWNPQGLMVFFRKSQITVQFIGFLTSLLSLFLFFSLIGLFSRASVFVTAILLSILFALKMSFGYINHRESPLILTFFIMAAYPIAARLSLDRKFFKQRPLRMEQETSSFLLCLQVLFCLVYFSAGISKLQTSGFDWITTPTLQYYLRFCNQTLPTHWVNTYWPNAGYRLSLYPQLCHFLAALTLLAELTSPLALFFRKLRAPIILGLLILQVSTLIFLNISFVHLAPLYMAWLPWEKLTTLLQRRHKVNP